jgi:hypothetical protein
VRAINAERRNPKRLSETLLPKNIIATSDVGACVQGAALILLAIPAQHTPDFVRRHRALFPKGVPFVSTSKGVHVESHMLMSEAIPLALCGRASEGEQRAEIPLAYMSGPSFAKEMVSGHPISVVVASRDSWCSSRVSSIMHSERFRVYVTDDVIGPCLASSHQLSSILASMFSVRRCGGWWCVEEPVGDRCRPLVNHADKMHHTHTDKRTNIHRHLHIHTHTHIHTYIHTHKHTNTNTHTHSHTYTQTHTYA